MSLVILRSASHGGTYESMRRHGGIMMGSDEEIASMMHGSALYKYCCGGHIPEH